MSYDDPDQRVVALNRRARLMREASDALAMHVDLDQGIALDREAEAVATEAMQLVLETGAIRGEAYYHGDPMLGEDAEHLHVGWALPDDEVSR